MAQLYETGSTSGGATYAYLKFQQARVFFFFFLTGVRGSASFSVEKKIFLHRPMHRSNFAERSQFGAHVVSETVAPNHVVHYGKSAFVRRMRIAAATAQAVNTCRRLPFSQRIARSWNKWHTSPISSAETPYYAQKLQSARRTPVYACAVGTAACICTRQIRTFKNLLSAASVAGPAVRARTLEAPAAGVLSAFDCTCLAPFLVHKGSNTPSQM